jgi:hypothetical protein
MSYPSKLGSVGKRQIKFYGPFDLDKLLQGIKKFLDDRRYEFHEQIKMKKGGEGWKFETDWKCYVKATDFVKKGINIYFLIMEIKDVEVVVDGKKTKLQHGRGIIEVDGWVEFGWQNEWNELKGLRSWYVNNVYKEQMLGKWADNHWYEVEALAKQIRNLLNFEVK